MFQRQENRSEDNCVNKSLQGIVDGVVRDDAFGGFRRSSSFCLNFKNISIKLWKLTVSSVNECQPVGI